MLAVLTACVGAAQAEPRSPMLDLSMMTFVASQGEESEVTVLAEQAHFDTAHDVASLMEVRATVSGGGDDVYFEMTCDRGELDVATNDFLAEGSVEGSLGSGMKFFVDWVRYDHEKALLYTDAPVVIKEQVGTYRGGGFRYDVQKRRFRLLGGASMVQEP